MSTPPHAGLLLDRAGAVQYAAEMRAEGKRLVVTNGVFDLLHVGHVQYLSAARDLGDVLLVGLNSDAGTRALKGSGRPLVGERDRAAVLLALRCVDAVTIFDEPTAGPLLEALRPPIYVKGGDYVLSDAGSDRGIRLPEEPVVHAYGGIIHLIPYLDGYSTSALLARIKAL